MQWLIVLCLGLTSVHSYAQDDRASSPGVTATPHISVGDAKAKKSVIGFPLIRFSGSGAQTTVANTLQQTIQSDLNFMDLFRFFDQKGFLEKPGTGGIAPETFSYEPWRGIGVDLLIRSQLTISGSEATFEAYVYDVSSAKSILGKRYTGVTSEIKSVAHKFANDFVEKVTGTPGIFNTRITMSCDRNSLKKEIYVMNFDGSDIKQITKHQSVAYSPAWSPNGKKIAYTVIAKRKNNIKNNDLFEFDFETSTARLLSNRKGINSGASYSPDGKRIALTMSFLGNPDIFMLNPANSEATVMTKSLGFDVDPAHSPDGRKIVFSSTRSGPPMIWMMENTPGAEPKRITFAGRYNAAPQWSPRGNKIVFASQVDKHFDIFMMNPDGTNLERLTKNQGSNEDPFFSPDGNFIVFTSTRAGKANTYIMNIDGSFVKRLTYDLGNCTGPKWSTNLN